MRRIWNLPLGSAMGIGPKSFQEGNPEVWVQLGDEPQNPNADIWVTVQELKGEMAQL